MRIMPLVLLGVLFVANLLVTVEALRNPARFHRSGHFQVPAHIREPVLVGWGIGRFLVVEQAELPG